MTAAPKKAQYLSQSIVGGTGHEEGHLLQETGRSCLIFRAWAVISIAPDVPVSAGVFVWPFVATSFVSLSVASHTESFVAT